ncbi:hypothetical protein CLOM_g10687 [Closterium sp. NIES-68]|nr:hypothetical protein CLOM_g10687 [Closterium sp. NIES-68]GJP60037.1 hypothetical protein CLOP_g17179 [Closterium sp. NIES-67]
MHALAWKPLPSAHTPPPLAARAASSPAHKPFPKPTAEHPRARACVRTPASTSYRSSLCSPGTRSRPLALPHPAPSSPSPLRPPLASPLAHSPAEPRHRQPCLAARATSAAQAGPSDQSGATPGEAAAEGPSKPDSLGSEPSGSGGKRWGWNWRAWRGRESMGERVMSGIVNSSSAPIGSFIAQPATALHRLDPRVKQLWLLMLVLLPARSGLELRLWLSAFLVALTLLALPANIARAQLWRSLLFAAFIFVGLAFSTDGVPAFMQPRPLPHALEPLALAASSAASSASLALGPPASVAPLLPSGYRYVLLQLGPLLLTRRAAKLAAMAASLSFIVLHAAAVSLITTSPEAMAGALRWGMRPLAGVGARVDTAILALLLSLRFLGLVFDEVRSLALGVVARGIPWKQLQPLATLDLVLSLAGRLFQNLFTHADQIAQAMIARGFSGDPAVHRLYFLGHFALHAADWAALLLLAAITAAAACCGLLLAA